MKRPMVWALVFLVIGILAGRYFHDGILILFLVTGLLAAALYIRLKSVYVLYFTLLSLLGFFLVVHSVNPQSPGLQAMADAELSVSVEGVVAEVAKTSTGRIKLRLVTEAVISEDGMTVREKIAVQVILKENEKADIGQKIKVTGRLRNLDPARNPGAYNEFEYLRARKIQYKMFSETVELYDVSFDVRAVFAKIRARLTDVFYDVLPAVEAGIMTAIIIGDKYGIDDDTLQLFRDVGVYHILVVSGMHITVLSVFLLWSLSFLLGERISGIAVLVFLIFYCVLTGAGASTVRAVIMCSTVIVSRLVSRDSDEVVSTCFAGILLLLYEPLYLWDVGFLYSFAAVFGLIIGVNGLDRGFVLLAGKIPVLQKFFRNRFISKYFAASLAASLVTFPITAYAFFTISPIGVIVNMLIAPTAGILIIAGFIVCVAGLFSASISSFISIICLLILWVYKFIFGLATYIPFSKILTGRPHVVVLAAYILGLCVLFYMLYATKEKFVLAGKVCVASTAAFVLSVVAVELIPKRLEVAILDVGQGDGIVINKGRSTILIDGGGNALKGIQNNTGKNVIIPYLNYKGIEQIEAAFITHLDADHAIGVIEAMREKRVKRLFLAATVLQEGEKNRYYVLLMQAAQIYDTQVIGISAGDEMMLNDEIQIYCIYPEAENRLEGNEQSIVLRLSYGDADFLFTGDIGIKSEKQILNNYPELEAEVFKMAHHGSRYSNSSDFIQMASPEIAVVSAGRNNTYGHPVPEIVQRFEDAGAAVYDTPTGGAILIETDGKQIFVRTMTGK